MARYASAMLAGKWSRDRERERVVFAGGRLRNGNHRMHAIVRAGVTVELGFHGDPPEVSDAAL